MDSMSIIFRQGQLFIHEEQNLLQVILMRMAI